MTESVASLPKTSDGRSVTCCEGASMNPDQHSLLGIAGLWLRPHIQSQAVFTLRAGIGECGENYSS